MSVAIVIASKHGSTREIGKDIARTLRHYGIGSTLYAAGDEVHLEGRTGVIVGSAIYAGKWMKEARSFIEQHQQHLLEVPVWLFSSGPIGDQSPSAAFDEREIEALITSVGAKGHRLFAGKLDTSELSRSERLVTRLVHAPEGDFRDFDAIDSWVGGIAQELLAERNAEGPTP